MKITDLQIGNTLWDNYNKCAHDLTIQDLALVSETLSNNKRPIYSAMAITHDRLTSMGFRFSNDYYDQGYIVLQMTGGRCMCIVDHRYEYGRPMFYIHELQNRIYSLTGELLTVNPH